MPEPTLVANVKKAQNVAIDQNLQLEVQDGEVQTVRVKIVKGEEKGTVVPGALKAQDDFSYVWTAKERLEPNATYQYVVKGVKRDSQTWTKKKTFTTKNLTLDEQTYASVAPLDKAVVGIGQPVVARFDVPVLDKKNFEKSMEVQASPQQPGAWHWMSDYEARWRPKTYWKPNSKVTVDLQVNSLAAGNGVFGQYDKKTSFRVAGESKIVKVDMQKQQLQALVNGKVVNTIPVSTGKPGFTTRSGTKIIMEKHRFYDMNSTSIGIDPNSSEGYDLSDVEYAMRLTNSGEFFHAAPWNSSLMGVSAASHGCTGMDTADAAWLYDFVEVGTPIEFTGSDEQMTIDNGFGDWTVPFKEYRQGSALS